MNILSNYLNNFQQNIMSKATNAIEKSTLQLSTGKRINSGFDDAAGLQVTTRLTSQINGSNKAIQNIKSGISVLETTEGHLSSIQEMLQRMRELAIQGKNGVYSAEQYKSIEAEILQLQEGINQVAKISTFNNLSILSGGNGASLSGNSLMNQRITIDNIPVDTTGGAKTTVEFWMNWDGLTEIAKPFGWNGLYDLGFQGTVDPAFGFNTGNSNILGISSEGLKNKWVHVAAVFVNGKPTPGNVELYINGEKQELKEMLPSSPTTSSRTVTSSIFLGGWGFNDSYDFGGGLDELKIWNGSRTEQEIVEGMHKSLEGDEENLLGYWKIDDQTLKDETANGNDGKFINGANLGSGISQTVSVHTGEKYNASDNISLFSVSADILNVSNLSLTDDDMLVKIDRALESISQQRGYIGTKINQYQYKLDHQTNASIQHQQSRKLLEEVDMSNAMSNLTKSELKLNSVQKIMTMNWQFQEEKMRMLMQ